MAPLRRSLRRPKGIGGVLVRQLITEALDRRVPLRLRVLRGNSALHFYERLGVLIIEQTPERTYMKYRTHPPLILPRLSDNVVTASVAKETFHAILCNRRSTLLLRNRSVGSTALIEQEASRVERC